MFNKGQLAGLMKQAQAMQDNLKKAQDELGHVEVTGESGSGLVKVTMTCKHEVRRVQIDASLLTDDKDMLLLSTRPGARLKTPARKRWASSRRVCRACPAG